MMQLLKFIWNLLIGAALTLTPVTAIAVIGWVQNRMARRITGAAAPASSWFLDHESLATARTGHHPFWRRVGLEMYGSFGGLWRNFKAGLAVIVPLTVILLPAQVLWLVAWWAGWENSFNKGYEQSWVGPVTGLLAVAYFGAAMIFVPLAEARFAVERSWRGFFDFPLLWRMARRNPLTVLALTSVFVVAGLLVAGLRIAPLGLGNSGATPDQIAQIAGLYSWLCALTLFPLYWLSRAIAARLYRGAAAERTTMTGGWGWIVAPFAAAWSGAVLTAALALWVFFAFLIFAGQFLVYDPLAWLNHPILQIPTVLSIFRPPG